MTGPGRPAIGPVVKVRLDSGLLADVDHLAHEWEVTRAEAIRRLVFDGLGRHLADYSSNPQ